MGEISNFLQGRQSEIQQYLQLIEQFEQVKSGAAVNIRTLPHDPLHITTTQQRMLYSGVYLQLYSLVEAVVSKILEEIYKNIELGKHQPAELNTSLRKEWIRVKVSTHKGSAPDTLLDNITDMIDTFFIGQSFVDTAIDTEGGKNWDHKRIMKKADEIGCELKIKKKIYDSVMRRRKDDMGALDLIKAYRNQLAHGNISFEECGRGIVTADLKDLASDIFDYLKELARRSDVYISRRRYLHSP